MTTTTLFFFSLCLAVCALMALVVIWPWMRGRHADDNRLMQLNVATFRERLTELGDDLVAGRISQAVHDTQVVDLKRQLLAAQSDDQAMRPASIKSRFIVLIWVPILSLMAYLIIDNRTAVFDLWQAQDRVGQIADDLMTGKIDVPPEWATKDSAALMSAIQTNVHYHADDAKRWMRLSELFLAMDAKPQALEAFARAYRLDPNEEVAAAYAQLSFFSNDGQLNVSSRQVLSDILSNNPKHEGAQMLMAMGEMRAGNYAAAQGWVTRLRSSIAAKSGDHSAALSSLDALSQTIHDQATKAAQGIQVNITVETALLAQIAAEDILFVSISDVAGGAPYAVQRMPASSLRNGQLSVHLSDLHAMMPERTLNKAREAGVKLALTARISKSGDAISQSGDLSANPVILSSNQNQAAIVIDQVLP